MTFNLAYTEATMQKRLSLRARELMHLGFDDLVALYRKLYQGLMYLPPASFNRSARFLPAFSQLCIDLCPSLHCGVKPCEAFVNVSRQLSTPFQKNRVPYSPQ